MNRVVTLMTKPLNIKMILLIISLMMMSVRLTLFTARLTLIRSNKFTTSKGTIDSVSSSSSFRSHSHLHSVTVTPLVVCRPLDRRPT